jgi:hypothetical protein
MRPIAFVALLFTSFALAGEPAHPSGASPHGSSTACLSCHVDREGKSGFVGGSASAACLTCHSTAENLGHQIALSPVRAQVPQGFPLPNGMVGCETCHEEPASTGHGVAKDNPRFFRGGPYQHLGDLCANCHRETAVARFNPHEAMRDPTKAATTCNLCHATIPEVGQVIEDLRLPQAETCHGCHVATVHAGLPEHVAAKLSPDMATRAKAAGLHFAADGQVTCLSCHDPHPPGATPVANARIGWSSERVVSQSWTRDVLLPEQSGRTPETATGPVLYGDDMLRLSLKNAALCHACHGSGPIRVTGGKK